MEGTLPPPETIRSTAHDVLQRTQYELNAFEPTSAPILKRLIKFVGGLLDQLYAYFQQLYSLSPVMAWVVVIGLFVVVGLLVWHMIYSLQQALGVQAHGTTTAETQRDAGVIPEEWEKRARECAMSGDYIGAVRALFIASICTLEAAQKKTMRRGATNREYLKRFQNTAAFEPLSLFVSIIDTKWYSGGSCSLDDFQRSEEAFARLRRVAGGLHADRA